uniref:Huntingtin n=1 Tax=Magallana gigas TaxID=29159 RepID=K1R9H4_MAGGI
MFDNNLERGADDSTYNLGQLVSLSDLFVEREQYEWMLDFLLDIYKAHPPEDGIVMQYINVGLSKAGAVIGLDSSAIEKLMKLLAHTCRVESPPCTEFCTC